jgi:hypothetical protein
MFQQTSLVQLYREFETVCVPLKAKTVFTQLKINLSPSEYVYPDFFEIKKHGNNSSFFRPLLE